MFLGIVRSRADRLPFVVPDEAYRVIYRYLNEWIITADESDVFEWESDENREEVKVVLQYGYNLSLVGHEQKDLLSLPDLSAAGAAFEHAMLEGFLAAIADDGDEDFSRRIFEAWPANTPAVT